MAKTLTLFLNTTPYNYENTYTAMKIAETALQKGMETRLVASTDGIYCFLKGQAGSGMPNAGEGLTALMNKGLKVSL